MTTRTRLMGPVLAGVLAAAACSPAPPPVTSEPAATAEGTAPPAAAQTAAESRGDGEIATAPPPAVTSEPATTVASAPPPPAATGVASVDRLPARSPSQLDPGMATERAPATFIARFETTAGTFDMRCTRDWSPAGVDRFFNLVKIGFFEGVAFFRVIREPKPFIVQFGIHGDPAVSKRWVKSQLPGEPIKHSNTRGTLSYAMAGSNDTRTTQLFFNYADNGSLDKLGFGPICEVTGSGMADVVDKLFAGYGGEPSNEQDRIQKEGRVFLSSKYPKLDLIRRAQIVNAPVTR